MADYQVPVTLTTAIMGNPYSNVNADGSDIRFTGSDGTTLQDYWIESWDNTGTSRVWVEVATSGTSTIYMYYGNAVASSTSDGDATFEFFDDFPGASLNATKWDSWDADLSVSGSVITITNTAAWGGIGSLTEYSLPYIFVVRAQKTTTLGLGEVGLEKWYAATGDDTLNIFDVWGTTRPQVYYTSKYDGTDEWDEVGTWDLSTWYHYEIKAKSGEVVYYRDSALQNTEVNAASIPAGSMAVLFSSAANNDQLLVDYCFIAKYTSPEPTATVGTGEPLNYQPDNQIRNQGDGAYIGDDIYNTDGTNQTKAQTVDDNVTATYEIKIENDGNTPDTFTVTGTAGGGGWTVNYFDALAGGSDITAQVTGAGWSTGALAVAASTEIRVEVTPSGLAAGSSKDVLVTSTSAGDASQDAVKATTSVQVNIDFTCRIRATGGDYNKLSTWETAIQSDLTAAGSKVFTVSDIGTYNAAQDDGQAVTFDGGGTGILKHINTENAAFIINCSGTINTGTVNIGGTGHSFIISDTDNHIGLAIAECYNDWPGGLDDLLVIDDWTTNANHYVKVTVAAGHRHNGTAGTGFRIEPSAAGHAIQTLEDYTQIEWVEITDWSTDVTGSYDGINLQADNALVQYVIIHDDGHGSQTNSDCNGITVELNNITSTVRNSIIYHIARSGVTIHNITGATLNIYNTTVYSCTEADNLPGSYGCVGRYGGSGTINAKNVIAMDPQNGGHDFFGGTWGSCSNNLSSDSTAPGSNSLINKASADQFVSIAPGSEDFHLKAGADAIDAGTDLSVDFTDDIDGNTRFGIWDIGADEILFYQPDKQIRKPCEGSYTGDGIYNNDGTGQTRAQSVENNVTATYAMRVENDGNMPDTFTVTGTAGGGGWTVNYFDALAGGTDITAQVTGAGWSTGALNPTASTEIRVEVTPSGLAAGSSKDVLVTSTSAGDGAKQDTVRATTVVFEPGAWYNTGWLYRKRITIDHTQIPIDLTNFPVLINLTTDADLAAHAQDDGDDILFTSADGITKLSHEIEGFNGTSGALVAWVKIPFLSSTVDTEIYMYYGNPLAANQEDVANVWDANYIAVWHLSEDPTGTIFDSTAHDNDGTTYGSMTPGDLIDAQIGSGLDLDGSSDYIQWPLNNGLNITGDQITLSGWARTPAGGVDNDEALINKIGSGYPYMLGMQDSADPSQDLHNARVYNGSKQVRIEPVSVPRGEWVYLAMRYDGSDVYAYVNGVQVGTDSLAGNIVTGTAVYSGRRSDSRRYEGDMDELRVSDIARPVQWVVTEYNNQSSPTTFCCAGAEEALNYQPDNQIRNQGDGAYIGDNIYNTDGTNQTKAQTVDNNVTATYEIKIENDGNTPDTFTVTGTAGGGGWTVNYFDALAGGSDITAQVTGAGWSTGALNPTASTEIRVEVTPSGLAGGSSKDVLVTSTSAGDASQDAVKVTTTVTSTYQPDNQIRNQGDGAYIGDNIYNTDGTNQTKAQTVDNNVTATYEIKIENDGNTPDTFTVTGTAGGGGWTVDYFDALAGGTDITAQVTGAGWSTGALNPTASTEIRVEVTPSGLAGGSSKDVLVTSTSTGDASQDAVKATTTVTNPALGSGGGWGLGYQQCEIDILGIVTVVKVDSSGKLLNSFVITSPDNKNQLEFRQGTLLSSASGKVLRRIEMVVSPKPPLPPAGMEIVGPAYDIVGYASDAVASIVLSQPARLTLSYDPEWLPENTFSVFMARYDAEQGWEELKLVVGGSVEAGQITCLVDHASTFAIMAELEPLLSAPAPSESAAAEFELSNLTINPAQVGIGEPVTISVIVRNTDGLESSYTLALRVNGEMEQSKEITLADGASSQVSFRVARDEPGAYPIVVGGLSAEFTVLAPESSPPSRIFWWIVLIAVVVISLVVVIASWRRG